MITPSLIEEARNLGLVHRRVHIRSIGVGSIVAFQGRLVSITKRDIKECNFMGKSILGDCYALGARLVDEFVPLRF